MGEYARTYERIRQLKNNSLFWEAKRYDLLADKNRAYIALSNFQSIENHVELIVSIAGSDHLIGAREESTLNSYEAINKLVEEHMDYIDDMLMEIDCEIGECEGYLRELDYIDNGNGQW